MAINFILSLLLFYIGETNKRETFAWILPLDQWTQNELILFFCVIPLMVYLCLIPLNWNSKNVTRFVILFGLLLMLNELCAGCAW